MSKNNPLVYSTETGHIKEKSPHNSAPETDGIVRIHRETKGRKGNGVSLIKGLPLTKQELKTVAKALKQKMGVGGSIKNHTIEIQSEQRDKLKILLEGMGYRVKLAGS
ncbi:translation initiation factor Sui1 [Candidatus Endobugula sertula]|uniref:Translation initiation factor Sui1 n=1 Tax=Candidatus Endobugula sertula TaxID=62101 RepID=A0A1D2QR97_9GAMM|nr:translation initiation factor Sui1 [Candidatus Endobugula sertula]